MSDTTPSRDDIRQQVEVVRESQRRVDELLADFNGCLAASRAAIHPDTAEGSAR